VKLNNELEKIRVFFSDKSLNTEKIEKLLNIKTNNSFDKLKDAALLGRLKDTNKLLSDTDLDTDKNVFYLNLINQRLGKLLEINNHNDNIEKAVSDIKPPIFWKDKQNVISQAKIWDKKKIKLMMKATYEIEIKAKTNSMIDNQILIKKLLVDLCELANAS
jgi:DNA polymerase III, delta subunit